jgi:SNF2 family DNA or RNA helicase
MINNFIFIDDRFIDNHIKLSITDNVIWFSSIHSKKTVQDFIKNENQFRKNTRLYSWIKSINEITSKHNDWITFEDNQCSIKISFFMKSSINIVRDLGFKIIEPKAPIEVKVDELGGLNNSEFEFRYTVNHLNNEIHNLSFLPFILSEGDLYFVPRKLKSIIQIIKRYQKQNRPNDENINSRLYLDLLRKYASRVTDDENTIIIRFSDYLGKRTIISPKQFSFKVNHNDQYYYVDPYFGDEEPEFNDLFLKEYKQFSVIQSHYTINPRNNEQIDIVLTSSVKDNLKYLKKKNRFNSKKELDSFLKEPQRFFPYPDGIIDNLSSRIIGIGLYKNLVAEKKESYFTGYVSEIQLIDINNQIHTILIDSEIKEQINEELKKAQELNSPTIELKNIIYPLEEHNLVELSKVSKELNCTEQTNQSNLKPEKNIILKELNGQDIQIFINKQVSSAIRKSIDSSLEQFFTSKDPSVLKFSHENNIYPIEGPNLNILLSENLIPENYHLMIEEYDEEKRESGFTNLQSEINLQIEKINQYIKKPFQLKEHQEECLAWLQTMYKLRTKIARRGVLLADDMGLGKTLQILSFIIWIRKTSIEARKPILIVAPVILIENWADEYDKFFGEPLKILKLHGATLESLKIDHGREFLKIERDQDLSVLMNDYQSQELYKYQKLKTQEIKEYDLVITNYDTLKNYFISLSFINWNVIILDEAQNIKNPDTFIAKVCRGLKSDFNIACTGTPVENSLMDLWSIFDFLQPIPNPIFSPQSIFKKEFCKVDYTEDDFKALETKLRKNQKDAFMLRRDKTVLNLGKKELKIHYNSLNPDQDKKLNELYLEREKNPKEQIGVLQAIYATFLHPYLVLNKSYNSPEDIIKSSDKLLKTIEILKDIQKRHEKCLVFCRRKECQSLLKITFDYQFKLNVGIINGDTNSKTRKQYLKEFKNSFGFNLLILSPEAAGVGLTITEANHIIHYERWWNPAIENQATDRIYRIGQEKDVYIHYLITKSERHNFEKQLDDLLKNKINLAKNCLYPSQKLEISSEFKTPSSSINEIILELKDISDWKDFESFTAQRYEEEYPKSKILLLPNNFTGIDLLIIIDNFKDQKFLILVQCKHTSKPKYNNEEALHNLENGWNLLKQKVSGLRAFKNYEFHAVTNTCFTDETQKLKKEFMNFGKYKLKEHTFFENFKISKAKVLRVEQSREKNNQDVYDCLNSWI